MKFILSFLFFGFALNAFSDVEMFGREVRSENNHVIVSDQINYMTPSLLRIDSKNKTSNLDSILILKQNQFFMCSNHSCSNFGGDSIAKLAGMSEMKTKEFRKQNRQGSYAGQSCQFYLWKTEIVTKMGGSTSTTLLTQELCVTTKFGRYAPEVLYPMIHSLKQNPKTKNYADSIVQVLTQTGWGIPIYFKTITETSVKVAKASPIMMPGLDKMKDLKSQTEYAASKIELKSIPATTFNVPPPGYQMSTKSVGTRNGR